MEGSFSQMIVGVGAPLLLALREPELWLIVAIETDFLIFRFFFGLLSTVVAVREWGRKSHQGGTRVVLNSNTMRL